MNRQGDGSRFEFHGCSSSVATVGIVDSSFPALQTNQSPYSPKEDLMPRRSPAQTRLFHEKTLIYGDNLRVLRNPYLFREESVDLIYLDPPFNSNKNYNLLFKATAGTPAVSQQQAFEDTWKWDESAAAAYHDIMENSPTSVRRTIEAMQSILERTSVFAYLCMMAPRLVELRTVLRPTGSIYLHCDPGASHYLKILMDAVFGPKQFRNEIVWHYSGWNKRLDHHFESRHDVILFYGASPEQLFNSYALPWESEEQYVKVRKQKVRLDAQGRKYVLSDAGGGKRVKRFLKEAMAYGRPVDDVWDIDKLNNSAKESLGYPTQKPEALLLRIIEASSKPGDVVLDPFCGCGTTIAAAETLGRRWIGIDISYDAIRIIRDRLAKSNLFSKKDYEVWGEPESVEDAIQLAEEDKYQFQWWAVRRLGAKDIDYKMGADQRVDGRMVLRAERLDARVPEAIISVKIGRAHV